MRAAIILVAAIAFAAGGAQAFSSGDGGGNGSFHELPGSSTPGACDGNGCAFVGESHGYFLNVDDNNLDPDACFNLDANAFVFRNTGSGSEQNGTFQHKDGCLHADQDNGEARAETHGFDNEQAPPFGPFPVFGNRNSRVEIRTQGQPDARIEADNHALQNSANQQDADVCLHTQGSLQSTQAQANVNGFPANAGPGSCRGFGPPPTGP
jgi:hypothetical protein